MPAHVLPGPAAIVISPTEFKALGKPIDEAASKVKVIGIDSGADSKAFTSFLTTDNVQGGRIAAERVEFVIGPGESFLHDVLGFGLLLEHAARAPVQVRAEALHDVPERFMVTMRHKQDQRGVVQRGVVDPRDIRGRR